MTELFAKVTVEVQALEELLATESERSIVLSVACFLEDRLRDLLTQHAGTPVPARKQRHSTSGKKTKRKKARRNGPPEFQEMVSEARARKLLPRDVLHDINRIAEIRNVFAHSFAVRGLANAQPAAKACERLKLPDKAGEEPAPDLWKRARHRFDISARRTTKAVVDQIFCGDRP